MVLQAVGGLLHAGSRCRGRPARSRIRSTRRIRRYANTGTSQPKFDARVDYELADGGTLTFAGGVAGTEGIIHSGIGPFDVDSGSRLTYATAATRRAAAASAFFTNLLNGDAANLLTRGPDRRRSLPLSFDTKTFDIEAGDVQDDRHAPRPELRRQLPAQHASTSRSRPNGDNRNEGGAYVQDEIFLGDQFRWVVGGRLDKFSSIENAVFSPRTTLMYKPAPNQTFRVSFNRAFRAPSFINNHLDVTLLNQANLTPLPALSAVRLPDPAPSATPTSSRRR